MSASVSDTYDSAQGRDEWRKVIWEDGYMTALMDCIAAVEQQADWSGVSNDSNVSGHLFWETVNKMNAALRALLESATADMSTDDSERRQEKP